MEKESFDSDESGESSSRKQVITPSPHGGSASPASPIGKKGPVLSIFGMTRLFSSPIRVKKRVSIDDNDEKKALQDGDEVSGNPQEESQEKSLRGGRKPSLPTLKSLSSEKVQKRKLEQSESTETTETPKRAKAETSEPTSTPLPKKKPIISPASSAERIEDDESTGTRSSAAAAAAAAHAFHGVPSPPFHHRYPNYPPLHHHAYGGLYSPYAPAYPPMYGYVAPHHPHAHYGAPPPSMYYPPYPPRPNMMAQFHTPRRGAAPKKMGMAPIKKEPAPAGRQATQSPSPPPTAEAKDTTIASVADWQRAAVADGSPPSTNRCVQLAEPIPSKFWGESNKAVDVKLPDFHRLVNFPDYLAKSRSSSDANSSAPATPPEGKKNCVMCGKQRYCSVSSLVNKGRFIKREGEDDGPDHIIPRQNKGLCTACDVAVWVVTDENLEIKWCKGCKNFRPWAAFGDKGSATKCVRCRDRQREKYALQKDEARRRRWENVPNSSSSSKVSKSAPTAEGNAWDEKTMEEHLAAANGLRNLIHAAATN
eukprot:scaffold1525_cov142-Cylindrotheca_fusiformis.AAC.21